MAVVTELPHDRLAAELDRFIERHTLAERSRALDRSPAFPWKEFAAMGQAGWLGLSVPAEDGGRGLPLQRVGVLLHRLAYRTGTVFAKLALQPEFCSVLRKAGSVEQVATWFRPLVRGERLVGNQITEPGAGSDAAAVRSTARRDRTGYRLTGVKSEVAFATEAETALVYARADPSAGGGLTAFLVPQQEPRVARHAGDGDLGERWQRRGTVSYRDVRLPASARLGAEGGAFPLLKQELTHERALLAAIYLGVGRGSWEATVAHVGARQAFGRPLSANQAVAFPLVEDAARLEATWLFVFETLGRLDAGEPADGAAAMAKWMSVDVALGTLDRAIQFHGGRGYSADLPFEQRWRDVRSGAIAHGPSEIMHLVAARETWPRTPVPSRSAPARAATPRRRGEVA